MTAFSLREVGLLREAVQLAQPNAKAGAIRFANGLFGGSIQLNISRAGRSRAAANLT